MPRPQQGSVSVWRLNDVWLERYRHAPGPTAPVAAHAHAEYQIGLSLDAGGEYHYRGTRHPIAPGSLRFIQPGEMHASRDFGGDVPLTTHLLYVPPAVIGDLVTQIEGTAASMPVFPTPVVADPYLAAAFRRLCLTAELNESGDPDLEWDCLLLDTLSACLDRHAEHRVVSAAPGLEAAAIATVKAYLHDNLAEPVSLAHLAALVGFSPSYLVRAFSRAVGTPPHRFQVGLRVGRAKALIGAGVPIDTAARSTGFADQSHLGRHFKRLVGVPPGAYRAATASTRMRTEEAR